MGTAAILLWIPFSPDSWQWAWDQMPRVLYVPMVIGFAMVLVGGAGTLAVIALRGATRERKVADAGAITVIVIFILWAVAAVVGRRV